MTMLIMYSIASCDTCRKAGRWLDGQGIGYEKVDLRASPPDSARLERWLESVGADRLINRRSTTWRGLSEDQRARAEGPGAAELLAENPTLIKRPVFDDGSSVLTGFDDTVRAWLADR